MARRSPEFEGARGPGASSSKTMIVAVPGDEPRNAFVDAGGRTKAVVALDRADIRIGFADFAGLHRLRVEQGLAAGLLFEQLDHAHQILAAVVADVVERVRSDRTARLHRAVVGRRRIEAR